MKQLQSDPWDAVEKAYADRHGPQGPRHQHHRLRRLRGAGSRCRRSGPRLGNVLDQEERPSRQDRLDLAGSGRHGAGDRQRQASRLAGPEADAAQPVGSLLRKRTRSARRSKAKSRTSPNSVCSSASTTTSTAWFTCPTCRWDQRGEEAIQNYRKGDTVKAAVTEVDVEKERISLSIKALGDDTFTDAVDGVKRGSIITVTVTAIEDGGDRGRVQRRRSRSSAGPTCRATVPTSAPSVSRSATTSTCA